MTTTPETKPVTPTDDTGDLTSLVLSTAAFYVYERETRAAKRLLDEMEAAAAARNKTTKQQTEK